MYLICLLIWLIFSMRLSIEVAVAGAIISAAVYVFACKHMRYNPSADFMILRCLPLGLKYVALLVREAAKANATVFRFVFSRTIEVEPCLIYFRTNLKTNTAQVVFANSITLTPGSITVALNDGLFCVFCMNAKIAKEIKNSALIRQLQKIEGS